MMNPRIYRSKTPSARNGGAADQEYMIEGKKFDEQLLNSIKEKKMEPKPKWHFILKECLIWVAGILFLIVGAISFSLIIRMIRLSELGRFSRINYNPFEFIFLIIPIFWLALLIGFIVIIYYDFKMTKKGYRYPAIVIALTVFFASAGLGVIFSGVGVGEGVDDIISRNAPGGLYNRVINPHVIFWSAPEEGRISGLVINIIDKNRFNILDIAKKEWTLIEEDPKDIAGNSVEIGRPIRAIGKKISDSQFIVDEILPIDAGRGFFIRMRSAGPLPPPADNQMFLNPMMGN
jgi:hypothetical protein